MDFNLFDINTLKTMLKDPNLSSKHTEIQTVIAVKSVKPKVTVPEDQKISVNHKGFSSVIYLNKRYLAPVSYKGKRLFADAKFGGYPVLREDEIRDYQEFMVEVTKVFSANKA